MTKRCAIVGCGSQKLELSGDKGPVAISRLYTSNYFELKREYAAVCCDEYLILSAKHGLVQPDFCVTDGYDLTVSDFNTTALSQWVSDISFELRRIAGHHPGETLVMLAGQDYLEPLKSTLTHLPNKVEYPFEDTDGIGEQMGWLKDQIEAAENYPHSEQQDSGRTTFGSFE